MHLCAVTFDLSLFPDELFQSALLLLDSESQTRVKKFYHREDACRCLIGRLLPRMLLKYRGIDPKNVTFSATTANKPYIIIDPPLAYNVSHDTGMIVAAIAEGTHFPPAWQVGVDIMKVRLRGRGSYHDYVMIFQEQLTEYELQSLLQVPEEIGIHRFYRIWTMKEAYTKSLGVGLGYDFRRIEFDVDGNTLKVDGDIPSGWKFHTFDLLHNGDVYVGALANFVGGEVEAPIELAPLDSIRTIDAIVFVRDAVEKLK